MKRITKVFLYIISITFILVIGMYIYMISKPAFANLPKSEKLWMSIGATFVVIILIISLLKAFVESKKGKVYNSIFIGIGLLYLLLVIMILIQVIFVGRFFDISALSDEQWLSNIGTIFTYIGTIFLGLLALNSNNEMKKIAENANELNSVNKIIEIESKRFDKLQECLDEFTDICDTNKLITIIGGLDSGKSSNIEYKSLVDVIPMVKQQGRNLEKSFFETSRSLRQDFELVKNDKNPFKQCFSNLFLMLKLYIENYEDAAKKQLAENPNNFNLIHINSLEINNLNNTYIEFIKNKEQYLLKQQKKLDRIIYGSLSLDEIKTLYKPEESFLSNQSKLV